MDKFIEFLNEWLVKKAPALPKNIKEIIVKFAPWLEILGIIIGVPAVLAFLGMGAMMGSLVPYAGYGMARAGGLYLVGMIFFIVTLVLQGLSIPGLLSRSKSGWNMLFYATLVNAVYAIVNFEIVSLLIGTVLSLYLMFQVKEYYK
jgi:hypothetical protein